MERTTVALINPTQAHAIWRELWESIKAETGAGHRLLVTLASANRTSEQNAKFHAMCGDIAKSGLHWAGKPRTLAQWKVLLVSGHAVATKEGAEMVPGLEGEFVNLRESTAQMSKARGSSLIEYSMAFGAEHGVRFRAVE